MSNNFCKNSNEENRRFLIAARPMQRNIGCYTPIYNTAPLYEKTCGIPYANYYTNYNQPPLTTAYEQSLPLFLNYGPSLNIRNLLISEIFSVGLGIATGLDENLISRNLLRGNDCNRNVLARNAVIRDIQCTNLIDRVNLINPDVFFTISYNNCPEKCGIEIVYSGLSKYSCETEILANLIYEKLFCANLNVMAVACESLPYLTLPDSINIEIRIGNVQSSEDASLMNDPDYQILIASNIYEAAKEFYNEPCGEEIIESEIMLKFGYSGKEVVWLQEKLLAKRYTEVKEITGEYNKNTEDAVKAFQKDNGIKETGQVDRITYEILKLIGGQKKESS